MEGYLKVFNKVPSTEEKALFETLKKNEQGYCSIRSQFSILTRVQSGSTIRATFVVHLRQHPCDEGWSTGQAGGGWMQ